MVSLIDKCRMNDCWKYILLNPEFRRKKTKQRITVDCMIEKGLHNINRIIHGHYCESEKFLNLILPIDTNWNVLKMTIVVVTVPMRLYFSKKRFY